MSKQVSSRQHIVRNAAKSWKLKGSRIQKQCRKNLYQTNGHGNQPKPEDDHMYIMSQENFNPSSADSLSHADTIELKMFTSNASRANLR